MKKTSINTLCILIIIALAASILLPAYNIGYGFGQGLRNAETTMEETAVVTSSIPMEVAFNATPEEVIHPSIKIESSAGEKPIVVDRAVMWMPIDKLTPVALIIEAVTGLGTIILFILLIVQFVNFIININRGRIFEHDNVKRLRRFGWFLIGIALLETISGIMQDFALNTSGISFTGYSISGAWVLPISDVIIGLISLLMAQIWARGIALRQEQELTI